MANGYGTLEGTVRDVPGDVLPGVLVMANSPALEGRRTTVTNVSGRYDFYDLPPGDYTVTCELEGFDEGTCKAEVKAGETAQCDVVLKLSIIE